MLKKKLSTIALAILFMFSAPLSVRAMPGAHPNNGCTRKAWTIETQTKYTKACGSAWQMQYWQLFPSKQLCKDLGSPTYVYYAYTRWVCIGCGVLWVDEIYNSCPYTVYHR